MRYALQVTTPPPIEPVTVAMLQSHLRLDTDADDIMLGTYGQAAREKAESYTARAFIQTSFLMIVAPSSSPSRRNEVHFRETVELRRSPAISIDSVTHVDVNGVQTILPAGAYLADANATPARLRLDYSTGLVPATAPFDQLRVAFTAGYGAAATAIPASIINAILITATFLYERRGDDGGEMPRAAEWLLDPYRVAYFGG